MISYYIFPKKTIKWYYTTSTVVSFMRFRLMINLLFCMMPTIAIETDVGMTTNTQPVYEMCGFTSNVRFQTWFGTLFTDSPVLFPTNDAQLIDIVSTAVSKSCKVRVVGAGHSEDGVVMQKSDQLYYNVIVISLRDYIPDDPLWHENLNPEIPSIRMSAGSSQIDMLAYVRPKGYLGDTGTYGRLFSLGGVYLNPSTFGAWFNKTRLASTVLAVRVLHANGTIAIYNETNDSVRPFQGSMGLLGIVTALEIRLRKDTGLLMTFKRFDMNERTYSPLLISSFMSDVLLNNDGANFFYFPRIDTIVAEVMNNDGDPNYDPTQTIDWYNNMKNLDKKLKEAINYPEWLLRTGLYLSVGLPWIGRAIQRIFVLDFAHATKEQAAMPNDGYDISSGMPNYEQLSYFIHCESLHCINESTKLVDVTRHFLRKNVYSNINSRFMDIHIFYRIFTVHDNELMFDHFHKSGHYIGAEIETVKMKERVKYSYVFQQLESLWHTTFPNGTIHHGKAYAYDSILNNNDDDNNKKKNFYLSRHKDEAEYIPFQNDTMILSIYTNETKNLFIKYMNMYDPNGTFRAGSMLHLLGLTEEKYTIKQYNDDVCYDGTSNTILEPSSPPYIQDIGCFSNCCDRGGNSSRSILSQLFHRTNIYDGICRERNNDKNNDTPTTCNNDCECDSNETCRRGISTLFLKRRCCSIGISWCW